MRVYEWLLPWVARRRLRTWDAWADARRQALLDAFTSLGHAQRASRHITSPHHVHLLRTALDEVDGHLRKAISPTIDEVREHL